MIVTRKDYQLIAATIKSLSHNWSTMEVATVFADALHADNARFDRDKFMEACGFLMTGFKSRDDLESDNLAAGVAFIRRERGRGNL